MEDEIKVGEYVRTENGEIHKVEDIEDLRIHIETEKVMFRSWVEDYYGCHKEDRFIVKYSKNIIDLIQVGDYVNGSKVIDIAQGKTKAAYIESQEQKFALIPIVEKQIKSIVTKEQFASIEYKVKE